MKVLKIVLALLGLVGLGVAGYYLFQAWLEVRNLWAIANANRSAASANPTSLVMLAAGIGAAGGLLLGIGIGLPGRTAAAVRRTALQEVASKREGEIRARARAASDPKPEESTPGAAGPEGAEQ